MLLHFVLILHFAAIVITFCVSITFCDDYYILRRNTIFCIAQSGEDEKGLNLELRNWPTLMSSFHDIYFKNPPNFNVDSFSWQNSSILLLSLSFIWTLFFINQLLSFVFHLVMT